MCPDFADNRPGDSVRKKADELKAVSPGRAFLARLLNAQTEERAFRKGSKGEEEVGRRLRALDDGWHVLHAIPIGDKGSDIDHLVIGPGGVFSLNTKNHLNCNVWVAGDVFMVNRQRQPYVRNSRFEGSRASKLLTKACGFDVVVDPVIVVMASKMTIKEQPLDVSVVPRKGIVRWLKDQPEDLEQREADLIYAAARVSTTWIPKS